MNYKDRLMQECKELVEKVNKLHAFKGTEEFYKLDRANKDLLYAQSRIMDEYIQILGKRMELAGIDSFYEFKENGK